MSEKQRLYVRILSAVIFAAGGVVYLAAGERIYAAAFLAAGIAFGYGALKEIRNKK